MSTNKDGFPEMNMSVEAEDGGTVMFEGVRRPHADEVVRVHPSKERRKTVLLATDDEGKYHMVAEHMEAYVLERAPPGRTHRATLFQTATIDGVQFLWPVFMPISPRHPVFTAMQHWVTFTGKDTESLH